MEWVIKVLFDFIKFASYKGGTCESVVSVKKKQPWIEIRRKKVYMQTETKICC